MSSRVKGKAKGRMKRGETVVQGELPFCVEKQRGGARKGSGPKRRFREPRVSHHGRGRHVRTHPVHVVWKLREGLPSLRRRGELEVVRGCFRKGKDRFGFRLVHYSVQSNHLHLIVEAEDQGSLSLGMRGLGVRLARQLNRRWGRKGKVFLDRYYKHELQRPTVVRYALAYVLQNHRRHGSRWTGPDPWSTATWFGGWKKPVVSGPRDPAPAPDTAVPPGTWLLRTGWRERGGGPLDIRRAPPPKNYLRAAR